MDKRLTKSIIQSSLFAAIIVALATYLAYHSQPLLAGFIVSIPVALPALWFLELESRGKYENYTWSFFLGIGAYFITTLVFYYLFAQRDMSLQSSILISMGVWFVLVLFAYYTLSDFTPHS